MKKKNGNNSQYARNHLFQMPKKSKGNNPTPRNKEPVELTRLFNKIQGKHLSHKDYQSSKKTGQGNKKHYHTYKKNSNRHDTPRTKKPIRPIKLFRKIQDKHLAYKERNIKFKINEDIEDMDLQVILMNTQTITASKFQEMIEACLQGKDYSSIFCFTEIKCDGLSFKPAGVKIFTKHRRTR